MKEVQDKINVVKVTLSTGKVVLLRDMTIGDKRLAAKMLGKGEMNQAEMAIALQDNLLSLLIVEVDGEKMTHDKKQSLDKLFNLKEHNQLLRVLAKVTGDDGGSEGEAEIEFQMS